MSWSQGYTINSEKSALKPVYMVVIPRFWGETIAAYDTATVDFQTELINNFDWGVGDHCFVYDNAGWEVILPTSFTPGGSYDTLDDCSRAQSNTVARSFAASSRVFNPHMILTTGTVSECTLDYWPVLKMPSGHSCSLLYQEGQTHVGGVAIEALDAKNQITKKFNNWVAPGKPVVILGGYEGLPFKAYTILYTGSLRTVEYESGVYKFDVVADFEKLNQTLFGDIDDFGDTLNSSMTAAVTTIPLKQTAWPYDTGTCSASTGTGRYAAVYFKVDNELMRATSGATVSRGELGTVAAIHKNNAEVDIMFSIQDNPVEILLYLLLSGGTSYPDQGTYDLQFGADGDDPVGTRWPVSSVNVTQFESIRDDWFPSDIYRIDITGREKMRSFIEDYLLKPMNANLYIDRTGKLSLCTVVPGTPSTYTSLTENDIPGIPRLVLDTENILNDVLVQYDYDAFTDEFANQLRLVDATSQSTYDRSSDMTIDGRGVNSLYGGDTLARNIANNKLRNFKDLQETISFPVLFNKGAQIEPGTSVEINHAQLPDMNSGVVGLDRIFFITSKKINWGTGAIDFEGIKTNFSATSKRTCLIAPTATADYDAATQTVKDTYAFISSDAGLMADGTTGYAWS